MEALEIMQIISIAVSGIVALAGLFGLGVYFSERARFRAGKKNRKELELEEKEKLAKEKEDALKQQQYENALRSIIREENEPLKVDIAEIKEDLAGNTQGTITLLRNDMKKSLDYCKRQGFAGASDRANWHELYNTYKKLGGNHFKEFVDAWKEEFDALPGAIETPVKTTKKATKDK